MIPHNLKNWLAWSATCMQCDHHIVPPRGSGIPTGICEFGTHHQDHVNAGYCPKGVFGSSTPPEGWAENATPAPNPMPCNTNRSCACGKS